jgi:serine/threonine protein kinase
MNRYEITAQIGDGSFGRVWKATRKENGSIVAIKQIKKKMKSWTESMSLREIHSLREITHSNIVSMMEVMLESDGSLFFVFEYMPDGSLYEVMNRCIETKTTLSNELVASYVKQLLNALEFLHDEKSYFHRDIKPENVLVSGSVCKLADFGLCRDVGANPPYTYYVSTRWYRSPEVILRSLSYGPPIDLYATGLILAELYSLQPLLPGSSEIDQIKLMTDLIGPPTDWEEGIQLMQRMKLIAINTTTTTTTSPRRERQDEEVALRIQQRLPKDVPSSAANLIASLLSWNPRHRLSAKECMQHELFTSQSSSGTSCILQHETVEEVADEQTQKREPSTVKRSNLSNERIRKRAEDFNVTTQREATKLRFSLKKKSEYLHEDTNEFSDYLAAVSHSSRFRGDDSLPTSSVRASNKIRPLGLFEKENRSCLPEEESLSSRRHDTSFQELTGFDTRKKKNNSYGHRSGIASTLRRGIEVQISNQQTPFVPPEDVAEIWDTTEESITRFDKNDFYFM